jgi:large conductance mechanosensitive channel
MSFVKEFKDFALRGNVIDLAIGVVIGGAFNNIVGSFVADIIMPFVGMLTGGINFSDKSIHIGNAVLTYGRFIQALFIFLITAFSLFLLIKGINAMKKKQDTIGAGPAVPGKEEALLTEIRDLLKKQS